MQNLHALEYFAINVKISRSHPFLPDPFPTAGRKFLPHLNPPHLGSLSPHLLVEHVLFTNTLLPNPGSSPGCPSPTTCRGRVPLSGGLSKMRERAGTLSSRVNSLVPGLSRRGLAALSKSSHNLIQQNSIKDCHCQKPTSQQKLVMVTNKKSYTTLGHAEIGGHQH